MRRALPAIAIAMVLFALLAWWVPVTTRRLPEAESRGLDLVEECNVFGSVRRIRILPPSTPQPMPTPSVTADLPTLVDVPDRPAAWAALPAPERNAHADLFLRAFADGRVHELDAHTLPAIYWLCHDSAIRQAAAVFYTSRAARLLADAQRMNREPPSAYTLSLTAWRQTFARQLPDVELRPY